MLFRQNIDELVKILFEVCTQMMILTLKYNKVIE